jgi:hypothetical protein
MDISLTECNLATWWYHQDDPDSEHKLYEQNTDGGATMGPASLALQKEVWLRGKAKQLKLITEYIPFVRRNYEVNQHG